jgi:hypothetical protein
MFGEGETNVGMGRRTGLFLGPQKVTNCLTALARWWEVRGDSFLSRRGGGCVEIALQQTRQAGNVTTKQCRRLTVIVPTTKRRNRICE